MIKFENVTYRYPFATTDAVKNLNFHVKAGEVTLVTGVSGCGKTTLMRLANGLCPHYYAGSLEGRVLIGQTDTQTTEVSHLAQTIGTVFQDPEDQFFSLNVRDEMGFALKLSGIPSNKLNQRIENIATRLAIDSLLDKPISALSDGQKQQVALGEILVSRPQALIFDEPSANLDPEATILLAQELQNLKAKGFAILVVDHRVHWLENVADQVLIMQAGEIKVAGDFSVLKDAAVRAQYGLRSDKVRDVRNTLPMPMPEDAVLTMRHLSFDYEVANRTNVASRIKRLFKPAANTASKTLLIDSVNVDIPHGITALVGANGSGKTTLARLITGLNIGTGEINLKGSPSTGAELLKHTGLVLQNADHQLQMHSVKEEVRACLFAARFKGDEDARITHLLEKFDLTAFVDRHPQSLSGGQKQRLVIACALAKDPDIVILDEPTSGLDGANMQRVAACLQELAENGKAVLLITHDLELLELCADFAIQMEELRASAE